MCYTIEINLTREQIEGRYKARMQKGQEHEPRSRVSAFALPQVPVITQDNTSELQMFTWGLIPFWVKSEEDAKSIRTKTFNAKSETIFEKPSFRNAIKNKRCLIPVNGFYEWHTDDKIKTPHFIKLRDQDIFSLAGIYDSWINKATGEELNTFSIVTTQANPMMEQIHNLKKRMPVILEPKTEFEWLEESFNKEKSNSFFIPYNESHMQAEEVERSLFSRK